MRNAEVSYLQLNFLSMEYPHSFSRRERR